MLRKENLLLPLPLQLPLSLPSPLPSSTPGKQNLRFPQPPPILRKQNLLLSLPLLLPFPQLAQQTTITFHFQRPEAKVTDWQITAGDNPTYQQAPSAPVPIQLSPETTARLRAGRFVVAQHRCETREKHIAQTGRKEITYADSEETLSCTFNYSDEEALNTTANTFIALAETMQIGAELARLRRFDRLGVDAELDVLIAQLASGRALEPENIAPTLQAIADDDRILERARRKAVHLLETLPTQKVVKGSEPLQNP